MSTKGQNKASKIIFVNSFKGGAGKTTLALTHCINTLFKDEREYENVIYMDLDILGTGTCYLFDDKKMPVEKCFNYTREPVKIDLQHGSMHRTLNVIYLNPRIKNHSAYGEDRFKYHQEVAAEILREDVMSFIKNERKGTPNSLFVLDCAPGFSDFEQKLLKDCYLLSMDGKIEVQEDYITTLDSAHIKKCIQCLNDSCQGFEVREKLRSMRMILNDVQNYSEYLTDAGVDMELTWKNIADKIKQELSNNAIKICRWKYSENIAMRTTYLNEEKVENQVDDYLFTNKNFNII